MSSQPGWAVRRTTWAGGPLARLLGAVGEVQTDPVSATRDLQDAADAFRREGDPAGELACMAQLAQIAWWSEQPERLVELASRLFEMALGHIKAVPLAGLARALIADVVADADGVLVELDRIPAGSLSRTSQSLVDWLRSMSLHHLGRPAESLEAAERACANASPGGTAPRWGLVSSRRGTSPGRSSPCGARDDFRHGRPSSPTPAKRRRSSRSRGSPSWR